METLQTYDYSGITKAGAKFFSDEERITNYLYSTYAKSLTVNKSLTIATMKLASVGNVRSATFTFKGDFGLNARYGNAKSASLEIPKLGKVKFSNPNLYRGLNLWWYELDDYDFSKLEGVKAEKIIGSRYNDKFWGYP